VMDLNCSVLAEVMRWSSRDVDPAILAANPGAALAAAAGTWHDPGFVDDRPP
jgi:hypothetical protein